MNKSIFLFFIIISTALVFSCDNNKVKTEEYFKGYSLKPINFLNKKAYLPSNYTKVNLNELGEMLRQNPELNLIDKMYYQMAVKAEKETNKVAVLYVDSLEKKNSIWFIPVQYFPLKKEYVNDYVNMLESIFLSQYEDYGIDYERLESKFLIINGNQTIKVKYKRIFEENERYLTQYLITKDFDSYSIIVNNKENVDYQKILKSL